MVVACVTGMLCCAALAARADEPEPAPPYTAAEREAISRALDVREAEMRAERIAAAAPSPTPAVAPPTVVIIEAPRQGWLVPTAEDVTVMTGTMGSPVLFFLTQYPFFRALEHNSATWRALPRDKQDHFAVSEMTSGVLSAFAFAFPPTRTDGSVIPAWKRLAVVGGAVLALGVAKEAADQAGFWAGHRDHGAEAADLAADAAGVAVGVTVGAALSSLTRRGLGFILGVDGARGGGAVVAEVRF